MEKTATVAALRSDFYPLLRREGFVRRGDVARRVSHPVAHVVEVVHSARSREFTVRLGVHLAMLGDFFGHHIDLTKIREPDCAWTASIVPGFVNDHTNGWPYLETAQIPKWARAAALAGELDLARALADKALPDVPERATLLRADLDAISRDPSTAIPILT